MTRRCKPIPYNGQTYPSQAALADWLGLTPGAVNSAVMRGRLETLGIGRERARALAGSKRRQPVAAQGHSWQSQADCAKDLGVAEPTVSRALSDGRFESWVAGRLKKIGGLRSRGSDAA